MEKTAHQVNPGAKTLLVMKFIIFFLTAAFLNVSAKGISQIVSFTGKNIPLEQVFNEVKKQTGYVFFYNVHILEDAKPVTIDVKEMALKDFLDRIFKDQPVDYTIQKRSISISRKSNVMSTKEEKNISDTSIPPQEITGMVTDEKGRAMMGVSVLVKGNSIGTVTDEEGRFIFRNIDPANAVLIFSYIGYERRELRLKGKIDVSVKMEPDMKAIDSVEVMYSTGYQNIPKERATGSFVQIDNKLLNRTVSTNLLDRILSITSGLKTDEINRVMIRGVSTLNANRLPLIVVDGFVYEENPESLVINNINPNDVENITILRDAAAASIWGARSGNGVIVITTKKGRYNQKANISINSNVNIIGKPRLNKMTVIRPADAIEFEKKLFVTGTYAYHDDLYPLYEYYPVASPAVEIMLAAKKKNSSIPGYDPVTDPEVLAQLAVLGNHDVRDDISKYLVQTAINQQYAFSISGGSDKIKYYSSVGYDKNLPVVRGNKSERLTLRWNNTYRPIKNLEITSYIQYSKSKDISNGIDYRQYMPGSSSSITAPYTALADASGKPVHVSLNQSGYYRVTYIDTAKYPALLDWHYRPLDEIKNNDNSTNNHNILLGGELKYTLLPGLSIQVSSRYEKGLSGYRSYKSLKNYETRNGINRFMSQDASGRIIYPYPLGGTLDFYNIENTTWNVRSSLTFNRSWHRHQVNAIAGADASEGTGTSIASRKYGYDPNTATVFQNVDYNNLFPIRGNGTGATAAISSGDFIDGSLNRFVSYYANAGYTLDNKYTLTASGRIDASNFFGSKANQRITPLWHTGLIWAISREKFYNLQWLPSLSLRATYGYNANMNNKATPLPTGKYSTSSDPHIVGSYVTLQTPPNPGLTWEKIRMINLGVDYNLFNQRIGGSFEYYVKRGINLIGAVAIDPTSGVTTYDGNYASIISKGFDIQLTTINIDGSLKWQSTVNISYNTDKLVEEDINPELAKTSSYYVSGGRSLNEPLSRLFSYRSAGLDPLNGDPRGYVEGKVKSFTEVIQKATPEDVVYHGSSIPRLTGNFLNTLEYKNIALSFNITFMLKYYVRKSGIVYADMFNKWGNAHADYYLRWQKPGDENTTRVPSLPDYADNYRDQFYQTSSDMVIKGDHVRLNDLRLSYDISKSVIRKLPFTNISAYLYVNNLNLILWRANKDGIDPNYTSLNFQLPAEKSIALGLNLNF